MKKIPVLAVFCSVSLALPCLADSFTLKDGSTFEGTILKEEADSYVVEVKVTKSIRDERKIAKADVAKIEREQPDLLAFEAIKGLAPTPDLMTADDYSQSIAKVEKFLKDFRASNKSKDAKKILDTLKAESAQVTAGGLKLKGAMVAPEKYQANAYEFDAMVQEAKIRRLVADSQFVAALRLFSEFDKDYRTTLPWGALSPLMLQVLTNYSAEISQSLATLDARTKKREAGLAQMTPEDRKITQAAIAEENAALDARYKAEKEAKIAWVTTSPYHKASLEEATKFAESEKKRLAAAKTTLGVDGGKAYRDAWTAVHSGVDAASTTAALTAAKTAGVVPRYLAPLEAAAKTKK
jgi:hypothetical protein